MTSLTWPRALAWRMKQQFLEPVGSTSVERVVARLGAIPAQDEFAAELSINTRRQGSKSGDVADAVAAGRLIKTFAFRGATHLMTPEDGGVYLALRAASRMWELPSWQSYYRLKPADWPPFRAAVREALAGGPLTRQQLGAAVAARPEYGHLAVAFSDNSLTLLKPLAWQGDMSFGPSVDGHATFQLLDANLRWAGLPEVDDASKRAVEAYLRCYGPATVEHLHHWLGSGLGAGKPIRAWLKALGTLVTEVEVEDQSAFVMRDDLDDLHAMQATSAVRLLPGFDPWVIGPGTADTHVTPAAWRPIVTRQANVVIAGGVVAGTWKMHDDEVRVEWFAEAGRMPREALTREISRLSAILDRSLRGDG